MPWHARKPDPWYAIRVRKGKRGIVYRVSFTRGGQTVAELFRAAEYGGARVALKAARAWRDSITQRLMPESKEAFSQRVKPNNTSGVPGVYLKRQVGSPWRVDRRVRVLASANTTRRQTVSFAFLLC